MSCEHTELTIVEQVYSDGVIKRFVECSECNLILPIKRITQRTEYLK